MAEIWDMLLSVGLGAAIGFERQLGHKPAGMRTHALVCLGSTMFILLTNHAVMTIGGPNLDPTRILHGIITGVGFLGAGSIMRHEGWIQGLTTAASIWTVAAIGSAVGVHAYALAIGGTAIILVVLEGFRWIERRMPRGNNEALPKEQ